MTNARVRRFDVFAVWNYVEKRDGGFPEEDAKAEAVWLAKVVAAKKRGGAGGAQAMGQGGGRRSRKYEASGAVASVERPREAMGRRCLSGKPQTAATYDHDIVARLGEAAYCALVAYVERARSNGETYEGIRDCSHKQGTGRFNTGWCAECSAKLGRARRVA